MIAFAGKKKGQVMAVSTIMYSEDTAQDAVKKPRELRSC
jgi:hypothetical protein